MLDRLIKLLPQTNFWLLRIAVVALALGCLWFAVAYLRGAISGQYYLGVLSFVLWLPLAVGLWLLMPWARVLSLPILWLMIIAAPVVIGPWEAINGDAPPLPVWEQLSYSVAPVFIPVAFFIEVLYAYKHEFSWPLNSRTIAGGRSPPTMLPRSWILWSIGLFATPVLLVALLNLDVWLEGGCVATHAGLGHGHRYPDALRVTVLSICVISGLLVFLRAAPSNASWRNRVIRALTFSAGMLWFYSNVRGYLTVLFNLCE